MEIIVYFLDPKHCLIWAFAVYVLQLHVATFLTTWLICASFSRMDRAAQHALEIDAKDKHHAQGLDDRMQSLRNSSAGIGYYPGIESIDNT